MTERDTEIPHTTSSRRWRRVAAVAAAAWLLGGAAAPTAQMATVAARDVWIREPRPSRTETAAFAVLTNTGTSDRAVVRAAADLAEKVELHETRLDGGMMRMMPVARIVVPAGGQVDLKPGGLHLMLFGVTAAKRGVSAALTLTFDDGSTLVVTAPVRGAEEAR